MLTTEDIKRLLPHREPMLLVDRVLSIDEDSIIAEKVFAADEYFFKGHFPNEPIVPGVLLVEAIAQVGGIKVIYELQQKNAEQSQTYSTYFLGIEKVRFRRKVLPNEKITMIVKQLGVMRHHIVTIEGKGYVGEELAVEATLTAQLRP